MSLRHKLQALREKYDRLLALHRDPPGRSPARRQAMDEVARRFPGSLREWQALSPATLLARREALSAWLATDLGALTLPAWVEYSLALHACLRVLLRLRQHEIAQPTAAADWLAMAQQIAAEQDEPWLIPRIVPSLRALIAQPPGGQLSRLAYAEVAARFGVSEAAVKATLFAEPTDAVDAAG